MRWNKSRFCLDMHAFMLVIACHIKQGCKIKLVEASARIYERLIIASRQLSLHSQLHQEQQWQQRK